jgi:4-alpha-glucanotransferase
VAPVLPLEASPYLPATRRFRNPVYLRVDGGSHTGVATPAVRVDRDAAWSYKLAALRSAYETRSGDDAFAAWRTEQGAPLEEFSVCTGGLRIDHVMGLFGLGGSRRGPIPPTAATCATPQTTSSTSSASSPIAPVQGGR